MQNSNQAMLTIAVVSSDGVGPSQFSEREVNLSGDEQRRLSEQISAVNFRLRTSSSDYSSSYHVAGDPTLLIVLSGTVRIELRNGEYKDFTNGEMFVAQDYLSDGIDFDDLKHGHRAEVVNDVPLSVLHLKLEKRS